MKKLYYFIFAISALMICKNLDAKVSYSTDNNTYINNQNNIEIYQENNPTQFKIASVQWLPDYLNKIVGSTTNATGGNTEIKTCEDFSGGKYKTTKAANEVCDRATPGYGLTCYTNCRCAPKFQYTSCPSGQKLNGDVCGGKHSGCVACSATGGWNYSKPCTDNSRLRVSNQECGQVYFCCDSGYQPYADSITGNNLTSSSCPSHQKYETGGGYGCARCVNKSCSDFGLRDTADSTMSCSATSPYSGKTCYNCTACDAQYQYNASTCTSPRNLAGSTCGGKYNQCNCPTGVSGCTYGCNEYYASPCGSICKECKTNACVSAGYSKTTCPNKYYKVETCSSDASYVKCTATCESKIFEANPTYKINESNYSGVSVITKNSNYFSSGATTYSNKNFTQYAECAALPKPVITLTSNMPYGTSISGERIENIDFVVNVVAWTRPAICSEADNYRYNSFCKEKCTNYNTYDCCSSSQVCRSDCQDSSSYYYNDATCQDWRSKGYHQSYTTPCMDDSTYQSTCNVDTSQTVAVELYPSQRIRNENYTNNGNSSNRTYYEGVLKNVSIKINGTGAKIGAKIGGGAHTDKTIIFEGTNSITGGVNHSLWVRGHNTYQYGIVRGVLRINSGASLSIGNKACVYNQWNGTYQNYGSVSGTVTTNCSTYPLRY